MYVLLFVLTCDFGNHFNFKNGADLITTVFNQLNQK